jgi:FAD/FMN-containing dehydrogenase
MALGVAKRSIAVSDPDTKETNKSAPKRKAASKSKTKRSTTSNKKTKTTTAAKKKHTTNSGKGTTANQATRKKTAASSVATKQAEKTSNNSQSGSHKTRKTTPTKKASKNSKSASAAKKSSASTTAAVKKAEADLRVIKPAPDEVSTASGRPDPLGHLLLEQLLRGDGYTGEIATDAASIAEYSTDESIFSIKPQVVLQPETPDDVAIAAGTIAREAHRFESLSITPRAAGTGLSGGSLTDSIVMDVTTHLHDIGGITYKKGEARIEVESGVMWRDMEAALKKAGYYVPSYTSSKDICSVGGAIGNNAAGAETLRYGHCADWVESLDVVLHDGSVQTVTPLTYKQFKALTKKKTAYAKIVHDLFKLIEKNEKEIKRNQPHTKKNTAGYDLWDVLPEGVAKFKRGQGYFNPIKLIAGSQGTIGIVTKITFRAIPLPDTPTLLVVPVFDLQEAAAVVDKAKEYNPIDMEVFDDRTFDLALQNPDFFKKRLSGLSYYRTMLSMYTTYHIRFGRKLPELMIMITLDRETTNQHSAHEVAADISGTRNKARVVNNPIEEEMLWQIRRASYTLSKLQDDTKRPAAFLEDMTVPTKHLPKFFTEVKRLFKEFNVQATVHGHAGNGHFHFYPLLDFTKKTTPSLIEKMSEKFFAIAIKYDGSLCGEHNDGIIRTPYLHKMFSKTMLQLFTQTEAIFDPHDIFNPGKKVNPRFEVREVLRTHN